MKKAMLDLDEKILDLKRNGKSLREIGAALQISHEAARKRLKALDSKDHLSTPKENKRLTASTKENEGVSTASNSDKSRTCGKSEIAVNLKTPSNTITQGVNPCINPSKTASVKATEGKKEGNSPHSDDLFGDLIRFLESNGIEAYQMDVEQEAYQIKHNGQIIRFYVQQKTGVNKAREETR